MFPDNSNLELVFDKKNATINGEIEPRQFRILALMHSTKDLYLLRSSSCQINVPTSTHPHNSPLYVSYLFKSKNYLIFVSVFLLFLAELWDEINIFHKHYESIQLLSLDQFYVVVFYEALKQLVEHLSKN